ncbi:MAG: translation initiation factor IF-3 [Planctomycetota bacterium]|nr:translation initiation factor IF-3 [Planctomycetota bacterium]MDA1141337.1 translation initiation factor IF-3 [Planctomycetota bacterium]
MNEKIRGTEVRLISAAGEQVGIVPLDAAKSMSKEAGLDLVEVAKEASPPVCRIMDYGKYKYELKKRLHDARKKTHQTRTKEIRLRPKTEEHDFQYKVGHAKEFLGHNHKVIVNLLFRGREMQFQTQGRDLLVRFAQALDEHAKVEQMPRIEGRRMTLLLAPIAIK